jgi:hypothetical protein
VRDVSPDFPTFRAEEQTRTPLEILAHIGDLLEWGLSTVRGKQSWSNATPRAWEQEIERFFRGLSELDRYLAGADTLACSPQQLFQAPIADALTHVGQIAMLRRLAAAPMRAENYFQADIRVGRVGAEQSAPRFEFD